MTPWEIGIRILCFAAALAFTIRYLTVRWYTYPEGRNLMALSAIITGYLALVVSAALFGRYDFYSYISNTLFFCTFLVLLQQNRLLHIAQREGRERDRLADPENNTTAGPNERRNNG
jgi:Kef-type K+ transport system membrane component KefB